MPLSPSFTITQQDGGLTAVIVNTTTYGAPNQERNQAAEYMLWSKTDKDGVRDYDNPLQGNVLTTLQYSVDTAVDGWYEAIWLRIQVYSGLANYVERQTSNGQVTQYESIFYYETTGKVYKAIAASSGQDPENTDYFAEVTDLSTILDNPNIEVSYTDFFSDYRTNACLRDREVENANCDCTSKDMQYLSMLYSLKQSADTNFANGNPNLMEKIMRKLETECAQC